MWKDEIVKPSDEEKDRSIQAILGEVETPWKRIQVELRNFSFSSLFFGIEDCMFIALLVFLVMTLSFFQMEEIHTEIVSVLFICSPVLYYVMYVLSFFKEKMLRTMEWRMTCKLSFWMVIIMRMFAFSCIATIISVPQGILLWYLTKQQFSLIWVLSVAFASLFSFSVLTLYLSTIRYGYMIVPLVWMGLGLFLAGSQSLQRWILQTPAVVFMILTIAALLVFFLKSYELIVSHHRREFSYVIR